MPSAVNHVAHSTRLCVPSDSLENILAPPPRLLHPPRLLTVSTPTRTIIYLFTTFPKSTETFLQREIIAMQEHGHVLRLYSIWGGGGTFSGLQVRAFNKWKLLCLLWIIPWVALTRWSFFRVLLRGLFTRRAPSWLNFWENMLGAGFAGVSRSEIRALRPDWIHATWAGAPATAAWCLSQLDRHRYSVGAHAYDIYEHGGDWWLLEKLAAARFIHTSTDMGKETLAARGVSDNKIHVIRRGLPEFPELKPLRETRLPLRIICVARLVEKKGLRRQLRLYAALRDAGVAFTARLVGDGPLREELQQQIGALRLGSLATFTGHLDAHGVREQFDWADILVHTGIVAPSGDRDGLPNVIPEAMSAGVLVITSPVAGTTEAITHGKTGLVAHVEDTAAWVAAWKTLATDTALAKKLQLAARAWAEENYDAHLNSARLHALFEQHIASD